MTCCAGPIVADYAIAHQSSDRIALLQELQSNVRTLSDGNSALLISTPSIHCGNCISTIESQIRKLPGIKKVRANLSLKRVSLVFDGSNRVLAATIEKLEELGFPTQSLSSEAAEKSDPQFTMLVRALAVSGFAAANIMLLSIPVWNGAEGATRDLFHFVSALIAIPCVAYGGLPFFRSAFAALRHRRMNMDVPISLGVLLATSMSMYESFIGGGHAYFDAATSLLFFLLIGRTLDHMMRTKPRAAADRLVRIAAKGGFVVEDDGALTYLAIDYLKPGMRIRIAAGDRFPVDGTVVEGLSDVDRSLVTGESEAPAVAKGSKIEAGTLNLTGPIDIIAVRSAQQSLTVAIAVLIITCPCALGLAVPVAHVVSAGRLFKAGILMKDGSALERLAVIDGAVFDKTGTLTTGEPSLTSTTIPTGRAAMLAKALALRSIHPAARAWAKYFATESNIKLSEVHEVAGSGIEASFQGKSVRLGRSAWVAEISKQDVQAESSQGVAFAIAGGDVYYSQLTETLRPDGRWLVDTFQSQNISCHILSGDHERPVANVAVALGVTGYHADMRPRDKLDYLNNAAANGKKLLMVGDGLNDAPALVAAYVSMAPVSVSDVGRTAADFVFTRSSLASVAYAYDIAVATSRIVRQNFGLAIFYNMLAVPLAVSGQLNPLLAAVAMSTSSIIVVGNSLRLQLTRPRAPVIVPQTLENSLATKMEQFA
jgi:P-type Cu2+ transporter